MLSTLRTVAATALVLVCTGLPARAEDWAVDAQQSAIFATYPVAVPALLKWRAETAAAPSPFAIAAQESASTATRAAVVPAQALPTPAPVASTSLAVDPAFQTALQSGLAALPPTPALASVWKSVGDLYRENELRPFWRQANVWTPAARSALSRVLRAREDALSLPAFAPAALGEGSPENLASQELALTAAVLHYARQAAGERVDPARISKLITSRPVLPTAREVLGPVAIAGDHASDVLVAFNPPHAGYRALREKLAELRQAATPMAARIPAGAPLRVGMRDDRVKLVRSRFGLEIATPESSDDVLYDTHVAGAVAGFQRQNGLAPTGVLTPRTVALLSGGEPGKLENEIVANMERWRWMPRNLGADRIEVDVPNFTLALYRDNVVVHRTRIVVGKPDSPTPIFSNAMKFIVVNPSWFIPPSILNNEILPKLATDPDYVTRLGYEMKVVRGRVSIRQPPGERNALGRIKFMFPNEHAVYLHDTPSRHLFATARRAFSHGCVRVENPMALASAVLRGGWTEGRIKSLVGGDEKTINLPAPLPIHIGYFTASIGADGRLQFREDLYGYNRAVIRALAASE